MKTRNSFDDHCWHIRGITMLSQSPRLPRAVGVLLARRTLATLASGAVSPVLPDALKRGRGGLTALGDEWRRDGLGARVENMVRQAEGDAVRGIGARLFEAIRTRAGEWRASLAPTRSAREVVQEIERAATQVTAATGNPNSATAMHRATTERAMEIRRDAEAQRIEIEAGRAVLEAEIRREVERLRSKEEDLAQLQQSEPQETGPQVSTESHSRLKQWLPAGGVATVSFTVVAILGVSLLTATLAATTIAALFALVRWRAGKVMAREGIEDTSQASEPQPAAPARRIPSRLREKLLAYGRVLEDSAIAEAEESFANQLLRALDDSNWGHGASALQHALESVDSNLRQEWDALPEGIFHEVDPGYIELLGRELAILLADGLMKGDSTEALARRVLSSLATREGAPLFERLQTEDGGAVAASLVEAASAVYGEPTLGETLARLSDNAPGQRLLLHWLDVLAEMACAALALGHETTLDPALSIVRLTIGLPSGENDPVAQLVRQRITHAGLTLSSVPNAIEFVFDVRNLPAQALLTHELSQASYDVASPWERERLWHYPRHAVEGPVVNPGKSETQVDSLGEILSQPPLRPFVAMTGGSHGNGKEGEVISHTDAG